MDINITQPRSGGRPLLEVGDCVVVDILFRDGEPCSRCECHVTGLAPY
jgi:hypothetical protein